MFGGIKVSYFYKLFFSLVFTASFLYADISGDISEILKSSRKDFIAGNVMVGIMNAKNGKILSINVEDENGTQNRAVFLNYAYEPGAVMMPITVSIAIDEGVVDIDTKLKSYETAVMPIDKNRWIKDRATIDPLNIQNLLIYSSNIGLAQIALKTSAKGIHDGLEKFGFSKKSGIDVKIDNKGSLKSLKLLGQKVDRVATSIGYGMSATPLQLMRAYSAFLNKGELLTPYLNEKKSQKNQRAISEKTAKEIKDILIKAVKEGRGSNAAVKGLRVGGMGGIAQIAIGGSYTKSYNSSFYGFVEDDKNNSYIIGVVVVDAQRDKSASKTATVVFKKIVKVLQKHSILSL